MGYDGVDNAIGGLSEIELWLKVMESNHEEMKYTQRWYNLRPKMDINNGGKIVGVYGIIKDCSTPLIWIWRA
jgi:hypothetical protein